MAESLQELIARGRFILSRAPGRFEVLNLINGRRTAKEIAKKVGRTLARPVRQIIKILHGLHSESGKCLFYVHVV